MESPLLMIPPLRRARVSEIHLFAKLATAVPFFAPGYLLGFTDTLMSAITVHVRMATKIMPLREM